MIGFGTFVEGGVRGERQGEKERKKEGKNSSADTKGHDLCSH